jgi:phosphopantetheinyl transferase (holo-ACP synthase)
MNQRRIDTHPLVGNDIIDLNLPAVINKANDLQFVQRICSPQEIELLTTTQDRGLQLWYMWTAKESAYKIAKKYCSATIFSPRQFTVSSIPSVIQPNTNASGSVSYQRMHIPVRWQQRSTYIHCVGVWPEQTAAFNEIIIGVEDLSTTPRVTEERLSEEERESVYSPVCVRARTGRLISQRVRELAKRLLAEHGLNDVEIIRHRVGNRWGPPQIWRDRRMLKECDLSLSHHGQFIAAAVQIK